MDGAGSADLILIAPFHLGRRILSFQCALEFVVLLRLYVGHFCQQFFKALKLRFPILCGSMPGKQFLQNFLAAQLPVTNESLDLYRTIVNELYFPTLAGHREVDHNGFIAIVTKSIAYSTAL